MRPTRAFASPRRAVAALAVLGALAAVAALPAHASAAGVFYAWGMGTYTSSDCPPPECYSNTDVGVDEDGSKYCPAQVCYIGDELTNTVTLSERTEADGRWLVARDETGTIAPGADGCEAVDEHEVRCRVPAVTEETKDDLFTIVHGLGGDDTLTVQPARALGLVMIRGGSGNDSLRGPSTGAAGLEGDAGDDVLRAGAKGTYLRGGRGRDRIFGSSRSDHLELDGDDVHVSGRSGDDTI